MVDTDQDPGPRALRLAKAAGLGFGLDVSEARFLRVRSTVTVELPLANVVARVEAVGAERSAERQVRIARLLAERRAPVARLVQPERQPRFLEDGAVTLWRRLEPVADPDFQALGQAVRAVHDATRSSLPPDLPVCDPLAEVRRYLDWPSPWLGTTESREVHNRADRLTAAWQVAVREDPLGPVIVHGDAHQDNAIVTDDGLILIDLENAGKGPASWDFAALKVGVERYGLGSDDYRSFIAGYGSEPGAWEGHAVLCQVYELLVASWAMRCSADSPQMAHEASIRVASVLGRGDEKWKML